jgi:hypothetical protein
MDNCRGISGPERIVNIFKRPTSATGSEKVGARICKQIRADLFVTGIAAKNRIENFPREIPIVGEAHPSALIVAAESRECLFEFVNFFGPIFRF